MQHPKASPHPEYPVGFFQEVAHWKWGTPILEAILPCIGRVGKDQIKTFRPEGESPSIRNNVWNPNTVVDAIYREMTRECSAWAVEYIVGCWEERQCSPKKCWWVLPVEPYFGP